MNTYNRTDFQQHNGLGFAPSNNEAISAYYYKEGNLYELLKFTYVQ